MATKPGATIERPASGSRQARERSNGATPPAWPRPEVVRAEENGTRRVIPERTPLIGRGWEKEAVARQFEGGTRLLTIAGPSGMGKTRLAKQVLHDLAPAFQDACFCDLSSAKHATDLESAVARSLDLSLLQGRELPQLLAKRGSTLLVLDNMETLGPEARPMIEAWLDAAPELQLLATSLVPLEIHGESLLDLGPLALPDAAELYLDRARRAGFHRSLSPLDRQVIEELVEALDRIPLAIELAAARVRVLPPRAMLSRISERFSLLRSGRQGRHGSLYEAITFTWDLLSPEEQRALAMASVFAGGFTLEAAAELLEADSATDVVQVLDSLRSKSLVQIDASDPPRFSLYESIRAFAFEKLATWGMQEGALLRHARWFLAAAEAPSRELTGVGAPQALAWLEAEQENLLAAHRRTARPEPSLAARIALVLARMRVLRASRAEEIELLSAAVGAARRAADPALLAETLRARGSALLRLPDLDAAEEDLSEALPIARSLGDRSLEALILCYLGELQSGRLAFDAAFPLLDEADDAAAAARDDLVQGYALFARGVVANRAGMREEAVPHLQRSVAVFHRLGQLSHEGRSLVILSVCFSEMGRFREARQALRRAQAAFATLGDSVSEALVIVNLGGNFRLLGELEEGERLLAEGLQRLQRIENAAIEALALANLGAIALERGELPLARQRLRQAAALFRRAVESKEKAVSLAFLAAAEALLHDLHEAERIVADLRSIWDQQSLAFQTFEMLDCMIRLLRVQRSTDAAPRERAAAADEARRFLSKPGPIVDATFDSEAYPLMRLLLERVVAGERVPDPGRETTAGDRGLSVDRGAAWFEVQGSERIDIRNRSVLRRLLLALVQQRRLAPGVALPTERLAEAGWPGQALIPRSARNRVQNAISTLRSLGLGERLLRDGEGYLIDPRLPLIWGDSSIPPSHLG